MQPVCVLAMELFFQPQSLVLNQDPEPRSRTRLLAFATRETEIILKPWECIQGYSHTLRMTGIWTKVSIKDVRE